MKAERNALQKHVFPKLRELCAQHGCMFQAIDLRWGIRNESALDQKTMTICLEEIARCQRVTPRPNFIVVLGDRYGWRPLPSEIPAGEFEEIVDNITGRNEVDLLKRWHKRDDNAVPPAYVLQPREGEYAAAEKWEGIEHQLRTILLDSSDIANVGPEIECSHCQESLRLNSFVTRAEWHPVRATWKDK